ncbi:MAG: serine hydrolase [Acetobacteraceae bacterium]|nr:serine hydrolase [Acetobacteraceae bacterium]
MIASAQHPARADDDAITRIVRAAAEARVDNGEAVGVGVGVITGDGPARTFSFGLADVGKGQPFTSGSIFQIGSVTKVFTTNLLGQAVSEGTLSLDKPLSDYAAQLGPLQPLTAQVTLRELGDFTAGFPEYAPRCTATDTPPGCLPGDRPDIETYSASDFAAFFRSTVPMDQTATPPTPVGALPAPYFYSDYSTGLLGLLLGAPPDQPLGNDALAGWESLLQAELLDPIGMPHTTLSLPTKPALGTNIAQGYTRALAKATVANGQVAGLTVTAGGSYSSGAPDVTIVGGGGTGAQAQAVLTGETVSDLQLIDPGQGYTAPPVVSIAPPTGAGGTPATGEAVVIDGQVVGVNLADRGGGYTEPPVVTITGGRESGGRDATAAAHVANGEVTYISVTDGGAGYVPPVAVLIAPSPVPPTNVPIWAPAGALKSTIRDMDRFARAALGDSASEAVTDGFKVAQTPYACSEPNYTVAQCPAGAILSALAWAVRPADAADGLPEIIVKNGGLPGFSTQVLLMPARHLGVVVFVNTNQSTDSGEKLQEAGKVAYDILYGLFYQGSE